MALLPLHRLTWQSLWYDELFTLFVAQRDFAGISQQAAWDGFTPPLYYALVALLQRAGLEREGLRLLSAGFGALALFGILRIALRLGGERAAFAALLLGGLSPFLFSMSQELRPYTAFLACSAFGAEAFWAWCVEPQARGGWRSAAWLLLAAAFSYLGLALLLLALLATRFAPRGRRANRAALAVAALLAGAAISLPGLRKAADLFASRMQRQRVGWETRPMVPLARLTLGAGLRPEPLGDAGDRRLAALAEWSGRGVFALALAVAALRRDRALGVLCALLAAALLGVWTADALIGIGVTTRYLSLAFLPFLLLPIRLVAASPRLGIAAAALLVGLQLFGLQRYLYDPAYARDDWRALARRLVQLHRPGDTVFGFPGHHVAVALDAYAPGIPLVGGFTGRRGEPVYLFREGERFRGYDFSGQLEEVSADIAGALERRTPGRRALLVSYADDDWHGDLRPVLDALAAGEPRSERFPGREILLIREIARW